MFRNCSAIIGLLCLVALENQGFAGVHLSGSVSQSKSNMPLQQYESRAAAASVSVDLGAYMRLGLTHRQEYKSSAGWETNDAEELIRYRNLTHIQSNSLDLSVILYHGEVFVPYIMGGIIMKQYQIEIETDEATFKTPPFWDDPAPNVGAGLGMRINREFTLKLSYIASPGTYQEPNGEQKSVWDNYTSLGISYEL